MSVPLGRFIHVHAYVVCLDVCIMCAVMYIAISSDTNTESGVLICVSMSSGQPELLCGFYFGLF